ncbi:MAG: S-layer homology domain-containing protein [Clostridia bacterium]|nr:S-layer homology domain-containing protein [Clostridia bacterium]
MKKIISLILIISMLSLGFCFAEESKFTDVQTEHWAYQYIDFLTSQGIINGMGDGTFQPEATLTRGQYIKLVISTILSQSVNLDEIDTDFDHWAAPYVRLAEEYNVISEGSVTLDNVDEPISRLEMVRIVALADLNILKTDLERDDSIINFSDTKNISNMDELLLIQAVSRGLVNGYTDGTFRPDGYMTRAEASAIIYRFYWL